MVVATGIEPRTPDIPGIDHPKVVPYIDAILGRKPIGQRVAIMGAGGIGFDVAELITHAGASAALDIEVFAREWGIDFKNHPRGGVTGVQPQVAKRRPRGHACCSARPTRWARPWAAPPAGRTA